jgi:hypothetical protein
MANTIKVISIDPGVTTGYAVGVITDGYMKVRCDQNTFNHIELYDFLVGNHPDVVICERFDFRKKAVGVNLYPVEMIGVVNYFIQERQRRDLVIDLFMQKPAEQGKQAYWTDAKLKEVGVYDKSHEHGRSAMKHLLYWYTFGAGFQYNKKEFGPWETTS